MNDTYYQIHISYEIPYNILDDTNPSVVKAREILYERLKTNIPKNMKDSLLNWYTSIKRYFKLFSYL